MNALRFASLRGASRRYIDEWDVDDLDELALDATYVEDDPLGDTGYEDPPHDGWSEIRPLYRAMHDAHLRSVDRAS